MMMKLPVGVICLLMQDHKLLLTWKLDGKSTTISKCLLVPETHLTLIQMQTHLRALLGQHSQQQRQMDLMVDHTTSVYVLNSKARIHLTIIKTPLNFQGRFLFPNLELITLGS